VSATLLIQEYALKHLLPTVVKTHYIFTLRDVSKVF